MCTKNVNNNKVKVNNNVANANAKKGEKSKKQCNTGAHDHNTAVQTGEGDALIPAKTTRHTAWLFIC